jgi:hypothetical protein
MYYVEGLAYCGLIPTLHAWCVDADGNVYDPTWRWGTGHYDVEHGELLGVPMSLDFVRETVLTRERYGVLDNFEQGYPVLRNPWDDKNMRPAQKEEIAANATQA